MSFIIFSGLPASGKSSIARELAPRVRLPLLDKDDFLEALFDERGSAGLGSRSSLSREADQRFVAAAHAVSGACLVSWWRRPQVDPTSGTPTEWLAGLSPPVIELYCRCRVDTAVERFLQRRRHPGHLDVGRSAASLRAQFASFAAVGPLGCGTLIELDTEQPIRLDALVSDLDRTISTPLTVSSTRPA
jgi:thymidylate kinase